jgi:C4-dicarboxylate transporter, DctQ subunit
MNLLKLLGRVEYLFLSGCMLATTLLLFINVTLRYLFQDAIFWVEEVLRYLFVWITFIGAATCVRQKAHISLDTVLLVLPPRLRAPFLQAGNIIVIALSAYLTFHSLRFVLDAKASEQVSATMGTFPMYIVYSCLPIGFFLIGVATCQDFVWELRKSRANSGQGGR